MSFPTMSSIHIHDLSGFFFFNLGLFILTSLVLFQEVKSRPFASLTMRWYSIKKENAYSERRLQPIREEICPTKNAYNMTDIFRDFSFVFMQTHPSRLEQGCPFTVTWMFSTYPNDADIAQRLVENVSC